jgi:hypothetical protein
VRLIFWPPFSPDLLQEIDPAVHRDKERLRAAVLRAHQRCLDVIAANGMETKW